MALARIKTWLAGDILTAADLNAEFNNPINNPITLISPTTGAINFQTSVAHTNLQVSALTASSGFAGSVLVTSTAATPIPLWSTGSPAGGVFTATTGTIPTWTATPAQGAVLISSTFLPAWLAAPTGGTLITSTGTIPTWLSLGTSGQILVVATSGTPAWKATTPIAISAAVAVSSSGDQSINSTSFVSVSGLTLTLTPTSTAARYQIGAMGAVAVAATDAAWASVDILFDAARLGGTNSGLFQTGVSTAQSVGVGISRLGIGFTHLTSVVSTASHTATLQMHSELPTVNNFTVLKSDPKFSFSMVEIPTTG